MKRTDLPLVGNLPHGQELRADLARAVTYCEVYGQRGDVSAYITALNQLCSAAASAASAAPRRVAPTAVSAKAYTAQPRTVILDFACDLAVAGIPVAANFAISGVGSAAGIQMVGRYVVLNLGADVGSTFTVTYTKPGLNNLKDKSGNEVANFTINGVKS